MLYSFAVSQSIPPNGQVYDAYMHACTHACMTCSIHICIAYIHTYMHACMHARTHACIYVHMQTCDTIHCIATRYATLHHTYSQIQCHYIASHYATYIVGSLAGGVVITNKLRIGYMGRKGKLEHACLNSTSLLPTGNGTSRLMIPTLPRRYPPIFFFSQAKLSSLLFPVRQYHFSSDSNSNIDNTIISALKFAI